MPNLNGLRQLVMKADLKSAFDTLSDYYTDGDLSPFRIDREKFVELQRKYFMGLTHEEDYRVGRSKLVAKLLQYINEVEGEASEEELNRLDSRAREFIDANSDIERLPGGIVVYSKWLQKILIVISVVSVCLSMIYGGKWIQTSLALLLILYLSDRGINVVTLLSYAKNTLLQNITTT